MDSKNQLFALDDAVAHRGEGAMNFSVREYSAPAEKLRLGCEQSMPSRRRGRT
jgi:hypothetical protein